MDVRRNINSKIENILKEENKKIRKDIISKEENKKIRDIISKDKEPLRGLDGQLYSNFDALEAANKKFYEIMKIDDSEEKKKIMYIGEDGRDYSVEDIENENKGKSR